MACINNKLTNVKSDSAEYVCHDLAMDGEVYQWSINLTLLHHNDRIVLVIPSFDEYGNLPPGIHIATMAELAKRFTYTSQRQALFKGLELLVLDLKAAGCRKLYVDGSFITAKPEPADYDACWEATGVNQTIKPILREIKSFMPERKHVYGGDIFCQMPNLGTNYVAYFQKDRGEHDKGIILIYLQGDS